MKKFFSAMLFICSLNCFGQPSKWFVSFSLTPTFGGPSASFKHQMVKQGFNQTGTGELIFFRWSTDYPDVSKQPAILIRGGKKINDRRSFYFVAGQSAAGTVDGFKNEGYTSFIGIIGGSYGQLVSINYKLYQLTGGYLYSFPNTRAKLGFGPTVFLLNYKTSENYSTDESHAGLTAGASFVARLPFGKEKKLVGFEFVLEGNMAPSIKVKSSMDNTGFDPKSAGLFFLNAGIALTFHR